MTRYTVTIREVGIYSVDVDAEDETAAREAALEKLVVEGAANFFEHVQSHDVIGIETEEHGRLIVNGVDMGPAIRRPDGTIESGPHIKG